MKTASKTMYTIGMVYAIVFLSVGAIVLLIGGILLGLGASMVDEPEAKATYAIVGTVMLSIGAYFAVGQIVEIVMDNLGRKGGRGIQIANIVLGIVFSNLFTLLGGAFGLASDDIVNA